MNDNQLECPNCTFKFDGNDWLADALEAPINITCGTCNHTFSLSAKPRSIKWIFTDEVDDE
jgi:hypothetical protein